MIVQPPLPASSRTRRPRILGLLLLGVLPLLAACTLTTDDPTSYNAVTEANVLDGCVANQDLAYAGLITVDEQGTSDRADDTVDIPAEIPAEVLDPCQCLYDGIVEEISFADFDALDRSLRDLPDQPEEDGTDEDDAELDEDEQQQAETLATIAEIADNCRVPS